MKMEMSKSEVIEAAIPTQKHGRVDVGIDFNKQIYNFKGHKTDNQYIYESSVYTIFSPNGLLRDSLYATYSTEVYKDKKGILLEDYAEDWITSSERTLDIFDSTDFLEQTCITHSILRIQEDNDSLPPYNSYKKRCSEEDGRIRDALLKILEPKILATSKQFSKKYGGIIEELEIYTQAYLFCKLILTGEDQKVIQNTRIFKVQNSKQKSRQYNRELRLHPLRTHKNSNNIDIEKTELEAVKDISALFSCVSEDFQCTLLQILFIPSAFANFVSGSMNDDSIRVYKPSYEQNLRDYIFGCPGRYSLLFSLLRDYFKTEIKNRGKHISFDDDIELSNTPSFIRKRWKVNIPNYSLDKKKDHLDMVKNVLSSKQFEIYSKWLNGNYYSSEQNDRQNLKRAKDRILSVKLNVPLPKIRNKTMK